MLKKIYTSLWRLWNRVPVKPISNSCRIYKDLGRRRLESDRKRIFLRRHDNTTVVGSNFTLSLPRFDNKTKRVIKFGRSWTTECLENWSVSEKQDVLTTGSPTSAYFAICNIQREPKKRRFFGCSMYTHIEHNINKRNVLFIQIFYYRLRFLVSYINYFFYCFR